MRTVHFRLVVVAAALLAFAGTVTAQDKPNSLLNTLEVRQLVARAEPADNARLSAHFSALADRYTAEAKRHLSMSQSFVGNPSRNLGTGMSVHCKRLAELNTESATTVRELAAYHEKLAAGAPATPPRDGARFQGGAGASEPTEKELNALAAKAGTPAEHHALEEYFLTLAKRYTTAADEHVTLAATFRGTKIAQASAIHDHLARLARDSAKEATAAAEMHKQLANVAR
ncbi:MAG TPA: hypothetical protein VFS23_27205 [Vicinamibacterales bacterium]|nr:hypothetical protein [Vicinamibacterales bacterium]